MKRRYGYFRCTECKKTWESAHVYCDKKTGEALYQQDCKDCKVGCFPYKVENIRCPVCLEEGCDCTRDDYDDYDDDDYYDDDDDERHIDISKPHRSDLCHKCRSGKPCT